MWTLLLLILSVGLLLYIVTYIQRRKSGEEPEIIINEDPECCGAHEICDQENLQIIDTKIEYFDDEELDELAGISPTDLSKSQIEALADVFYSMRESDVASWLRSLQLRNICLPEQLRDEALMIVSERRG